MLNTDLHNPNIKPEKKMSLDAFLKNNRGIASGRDLAADFLAGIYRGIQSNAISLKPVRFPQTTVHAWKIHTHPFEVY